jgi:hypothetical protein
LPDVFIFVFFLISPSQISLPLPGVINDLNVLTSIVTGMYPSNSFMDGSAIGSFLPVLKVSITALRAVFNVGSFRPSFQQCLKNAHPNAHALARACTAPVLFCALLPQTCAFLPHASTSGSALSLADAATC